MQKYGDIVILSSPVLCPQAVYISSYDTGALTIPTFQGCNPSASFFGRASILPTLFIHFQSYIQRPLKVKQIIAIYVKLHDFEFLFYKFFEILTLNAQKGLFWKTTEKYFNIMKKEVGRTKMAFWAFKSQNLEKVYKIKIKNHAILHILQQFFCNFQWLLYILRKSIKSVGRIAAL